MREEIVLKRVGDNIYRDVTTGFQYKLQDGLLLYKETSPAQVRKELLKGIKEIFNEK